MYHIQEFMRLHTFEEPNGNITILPDIINPKIPAIPACESCILERYKNRSDSYKQVKPISENEGYL